MESYLSHGAFDLTTPDGKIIELQGPQATVLIEQISPAFVGYQIEPSLLSFNLKSTLAQLGLDNEVQGIELDQKSGSSSISLLFKPRTPLSQELLSLMTVGAYVGKLFAADPRRRVRDPHYLSRMFGRSDQQGRPLLSLGGSLDERDLLRLEVIDSRTVAFLSLLDGAVEYDTSISHALPTLAKALHMPHIKTRPLLQLHQVWKPKKARTLKDSSFLLVQTLPLHIRTVFAKVVDSLLPQGFQHTQANILQPDTQASGNIYELFGSSNETLQTIPLEFYTLEPHREHVFFSDRDQLRASLDQPQTLFKAFETAPLPQHQVAAVFVVKGQQLQSLSPSSWIAREPKMAEFPLLTQPEKQAIAVEKYIQQQPTYPFLKAIEEGLITSEGILLCRHFPSPLMKQMLLNDQIHRYLKGIYFQYPSLTYGEFFSHEDRTLLLDLAKFGIPCFWVDTSTKTLLQYTPKPGKDSGMFVPLSKVETFLKATFFGIYGSNLIEPNYEEELKKILEGLLTLAQESSHPLLSPSTPIALVTGGGPGAMGLGNRVAKNVGILSCANIMDFRAKKGSIVNEQQQNPFIEAKMTYRLDRLVERQAEFNLDFPIFLYGGIGTDFEYGLEEVRRKIGAMPPHPVLLFGTPDYWRQKITPRFQLNLKYGTITDSEWISNCFYCVSTAKEALTVYRDFFRGTLKIGKDGPIYQDGFCIYKQT